ncbi:MAG: hypothetical protein DMF61_12460 [Blastocatellia bacterium AA13]|nr:MAG: hypothetical protein DMF61_12460 [Blastocatellia bacterium AA13]
MADRRSLITLTTDFGETDYFVGAMKGVIYSINPSVELVDITHHIPAHDVYSAAFILMCCHNEFPRNTIHLVVVDPGVGSKRRPIAVMTDSHTFVGPDNGVFSYIYHREQVNRIIHVNATHYFRAPVSSTFQGRDIFAPIAAYLAKGIEWRMIGEEIDDPVKFNIPSPSVAEGKIRGQVIHADRFGNIITNISSSELTEEQASGATVQIGTRPPVRVLTHFAEAQEGELFAYVGSAGFLELAIQRKSAARALEARRGLEVDVILH